jgi:hypothetical protein
MAGFDLGAGLLYGMFIVGPSVPRLAGTALTSERRSRPAAFFSQVRRNQ